MESFVFKTYTFSHVTNEVFFSFFFIFKKFSIFWMGPKRFFFSFTISVFFAILVPGGSKIQIQFEKFLLEHIVLWSPRWSIEKKLKITGFSFSYSLNRKLSICTDLFDGINNSFVVCIRLLIAKFSWKCQFQFFFNYTLNFFHQSMNRKLQASRLVFI